MKPIFPVIAIFSLLSLLTHPAWSQTADTIREFLATNSSQFPKAAEFYSTRANQPFFIENGAMTSRGQELNAIFLLLTENGLNPNDYGLIEWTSGQPSLQSGNVALTTQLEVLLTDKIVTAIYHIANGRVAPSKVSSSINFEPKTLENKNVLMQEFANSPLRALEAAAPQMNQYKQLKAVLQKLREINASQSWKTIKPVALKVQTGTSSPGVADLKEKLQLLGYQFQNSNDQMDEEFVKAVKNVFTDMLMVPEKTISIKSRFWTYINTDLVARIREVEMQMEKLRWLPQRLEDRHGFVNLANQMIYIDDQSLKSDGHYLEFKTVNGKVDTQTPSMKDQVINVIFNPTWTITTNIFINEELPKIKLNPSGYFARTGYFVQGPKGEVLNPMSIPWDAISRKNLYFSIVQPPSYNNALGVVKFKMTNGNNIYLHDTGLRKKFADANRLLSHGCVRLEKPISFAEYLLLGTPWSSEKIKGTVATPTKKVDNDTWVALKDRSLPMYLMSLTVESKDNVVRFYDDYYGHNQALYKALKKAGYLRTSAQQ